METLLEKLAKPEKLDIAITHSKKELKQHAKYVDKFAKLYYKNLLKLHCNKATAKNLVGKNRVFLEQALEQLEINNYRQEAIKTLIIKKVRAFLIKDYILNIKDYGLLQEKNLDNVFQKEDINFEKYNKITSITKEFIPALIEGLSNVSLNLEENLKVKNSAELINEMNQNKLDLQNYIQATRQIVKDIDGVFKELKDIKEQLSAAEKSLKDSMTNFSNVNFEIIAIEKEMVRNNEKKEPKQLKKLLKLRKKHSDDKEFFTTKVDALKQSYNTLNENYTKHQEKYDEIDKLKTECYKKQNNLNAKLTLVNQNIKKLKQNKTQTSNLLKHLKPSKINDSDFAMGM